MCRSRSRSQGAKADGDFVAMDAPEFSAPSVGDSSGDSRAALESTLLDAETSSDSILRPKGRSWPKRIGICCGICWYVLYTVALWGFAILMAYLYLTTLPKLDGTLKYSGLQDSVEVSREKSGMIHISGSNQHDVMFAMGVAHSQERLWQMEFQRRVGAGRLTEVTGNKGKALHVDTLMRTMGFYTAAEAAYEVLADDTKFALNAYTAGVNAYLDSKPGLPLEFLILGYKPEAWRPADSLVWAKLMSFDLSGNLNDELQRYMLHVRMGNSWERVEELMPRYNSTRFPTVLAKEDLPPHQVNEDTDLNGTEPPTEHPAIKSLLAAIRDAEAEVRDIVDSRQASESRIESAAPDDEGLIKKSLRGLGLEFDPSTAGFLGSLNPPTGIRSFNGLGASNNWVVGGSRTTTGKPFLCNDPHLTLMAPSIWILAHLEWPGVSVIGASFAGLPAIVLGHNNYFSWAVTNVGADVQDLWIMDDVLPAKTHYRYKGQVVPYTLRKEVIKVKGESDHVITVRVSDHYGPVVTDNGVYKKYGNVSLALRWVSIDPRLNDTTMDSFFRINVARNYSEFRNALSHYVAPSQNFIFADKLGNIAYQMPGKIPIRTPGHTGGWPVPGNGSFDWVGFLDYEDLPRTLNPSKGFIASANNQVVPKEYKYWITYDWDAGSKGYRAKRITQMIEEGSTGTSKLSRDSMQAIQLDTWSGLAKDIIEAMDSATSQATFSNSGAQLKAVLKTWDCDTRKGSETATLFERWYKELARTAGKSITNTTFWTNEVYVWNMIQSDSSPQGRDPACGNITCAQHTANTLSTIGDAYLSSGDKWGEDIHKARFTSQLLNGSPLECLANRITSHGGDASTVNVGHIDIESDDMTMLAGPSFRHISNLADYEQSLFLNPLGQSGNELSSHYDNLLDDWSDGGYLKMVTTGWTAAKKQKLKPS